MQPRSQVSRRQLLRGLGVVAASAAMPVVGGAQPRTASPGPYSSDVLPAGIRSRFVDAVNGLRMHVLEAGYAPRGRPGVLLIHGFPELAYSWRKVMGPLAEAGYHVIAPDVRGYGRTSGTEVRYDDDLAPFRSLNQVRDMLGLVSAFGHRSVAAVIGHDQGSPLAGWCALTRPDVFRSVTMMSAPFGGPPALPFDTADRGGGAATSAADASGDRIYEELASLTPPRKHYQRYYTTREANDNMWHAAQGVHAFLRAYYHMKSADWPRNRPSPLAARTAAEWAKLPRYYVMDLDQGMAETVAPEMPTAAAITANRWLPDTELRVYTTEYGRTGFQGGLQGYRTGATGRFTSEQQLFAGRTIDVPSMFVGGKSDWGVYQNPGALERLQTVVCTKMVATHLVDGAGHWVQQEQPEAVSRLLVEFVRGASRG